MVDSKQVEDNHVHQNTLTISLPDASKSKEGIVADSVSLVEVPQPTIGDFPDGGLTAWLVVVGVCLLLAITHTLR